MRNFKYGDAVKATHKLKRIRCGDGFMDREWRRVVCEIKGGLFLGFRWISNGSVWIDNEGFDYNRKETIKAALVSPSERKNPVYVPLDAIFLEAAR